MDFISALVKDLVSKFQNLITMKKKELSLAKWLLLLTFFSAGRNLRSTQIIDAYSLRENWTEWCQILTFLLEGFDCKEIQQNGVKFWLST